MDNTGSNHTLDVEANLGLYFPDIMIKTLFSQNKTNSMLCLQTGLHFTFVIRYVFSRHCSWPYKYDK